MLDGFYCPFLVQTVSGHQSVWPAYWSTTATMVRSKIESSVAVKSDRKPWGQGKAALLKARRNSVASQIAVTLGKHLDIDRVSTTGEIFPRGSLKSRHMKELFAFSRDFHGRTFTVLLSKLVIRKLVNIIGRDAIPRDPKMTFGRFVTKQALRFQRLVQRARRIFKVGSVETTNLF